MSCLDCRTASVMNTIALAYIEDKDPKLMMNLIALQLGANVDDVTHACGFKHLKCPPIACDLQDYQAFYFGCFTKRLYIYNITGEFYSPDFSALVEEFGRWGNVDNSNGRKWHVLPNLSRCVLQSYHKLWAHITHTNNKCGRQPRLRSTRAIQSKQRSMEQRTLNNRCKHDRHNRINIIHTHVRGELCAIHNGGDRFRQHRNHHRERYNRRFGYPNLHIEGCQWVYSRCSNNNKFHLI